MKYLLDTCVLSELVKTNPDAAVLSWVGQHVDTDLYTAAMVLAELYRGVARLPASRRKQDLSAWLGQIQTAFDSRVLPFTAQTAEHWASMCAHAESMGKTISAFDSIIAACALENGLTLVTRNVQDFAFVPVVTINPWEKQGSKA